MLRESHFGETQEALESSKSTSFSSLNFLKPYVLKYKKQLILAFFSILGAFVSLLILGQALRHLVDYPLLESQGAPQTMGLLLLSSCAVLLAISSYGRSYYVSWLGEVVLKTLRREIFEKFLTLDVNFFENKRPGELLERSQNDTLLVQILVGTSLAIMARNILFFIGGVSMMMACSLSLTAVMIAVVPAIVVPSIFLGKRVKKYAKESMQANAVVTAHVEESLNHIKTLQAFTQEAFELKQFETLSEKSFYFQTLRINAKSRLAFLVICLVLLSLSAIFYTGSYMVDQGYLSSGSFISFLFYTVLVATSGASLSELMADLQRAAGAMERIQELLVLEPAIKQPLIAKFPKTTARGTLALHKVAFSYPSRKNSLALNDVTISVAPGEKVALVGPSGSGKSTIFSLVMRFYDPLAGTLHFNGVSLKELDLRYLRQKIAWVSQEPALFSTSLLENIRYGCENITMQEIQEACLAAHLNDVVESLPDGLYTQVGVKGVKLSGGQKQRVAIARAYLRRPELILLDEATSSLDSISEDHVQKGLSKLMGRSSSLIIAHRLSTVIKCDKIIVLDKGSVVDMGTHGELLNKCSLYKELSLKQFSKPLVT